jgi:curved DNA-binding protein
MANHYQTLGITTASSDREIQRAYRTLARRYHPDVNPQGGTEEAFQKIAEAYATLSDKEKRREYDLALRNARKTFEHSFEQAHKVFAKNQAAFKKNRSTQKNLLRKEQAISSLHTVGKKIENYVKQIIRPRVNRRRGREKKTKSSISIIELSISIFEALYGTKKTVDLSTSSNNQRKVSVSISPGMWTGSTIRFRNPENHTEEILMIITVESHPWISIGERGVTFDIPISLHEALHGSKIQVPTLDEPVRITITPMTQSGTEVRLRGKGIENRSGDRGDLYLRYILHLPHVHDTPVTHSLANLIDHDYGDQLRSLLNCKQEESI